MMITDKVHLFFDRNDFGVQDAPPLPPLSVFSCGVNNVNAKTRG
jgi:hypothetical protein